MGVTDNGTKIVISAIFVALLLSAAIVSIVLYFVAPDECSTLASTAQPSPTRVPESENVSGFGKYRYGSVASDAAPCSEVGVYIMSRKGGSAVDAAIATMICIGVVQCASAGIGGGHFMTIYEKPNGGTNHIYNTILARERAPLAATRDMFVNGTVSSVNGGQAIGVPGEVKGWYTEWQKFGRIPWVELFQPALKMCREGHAINRYVANAVANKENIIRNDPSLSELFVKSDGTLVMEGDIITRPKLGNTLQTIADNPNSFYDPNSQLAQDIVADLQEHGGIITLQDLQQYQVYDKLPRRSVLQNGQYSMYSPPPPSSGTVLQYVLNILDGYNFDSESYRTTDDKILTYHRIVEAFKFAYGKRSRLGDEGFVTDLDGLLDNLTSSAYGTETRSKINDATTQDVAYYEPDFSFNPDTGTSHCSILAPDGSAVAVTSTINFRFGSTVRGSRTGIIFNNEMDDFSTPGTSNSWGVPASPSNYIEPGKMPMSSMSPSIVVDNNGDVRFVSGAAGGTKIITSTALVAMHTLWFGLDVEDATDVPRMHHQLLPNVIALEDDFDPAIRAGLARKGHEFGTMSLSNVQSIHNKCLMEEVVHADDPCITGVSDWRKLYAGHPDGF